MRTLGTSGRRRFGVALAGAVAAVALSAPAAQADFTLTKCSGSAVNGIGASFQNVLQGNLKLGFQSSDQCPGLLVDYNTSAITGSGAGRKAMGSADGDRTSSDNSHNPTGSRFGATDDAPTPVEQANMNSGPTSATSDDGKIHVIPVATGASIVTVNLPDVCLASPSPIPDALFDTASGRIQIPNLLIAKAFAASGVTTWGDLLPGTAASGQPGSAACAAAPIRRIVRQDNSGTTYSFKQYLNRSLPATFSLSANTTWPNGSVVATDPSVTVTGCAGTLCSNTASGNGKLRDLLNATDGGLGYMGLADGRTGYDKQDIAKATTGSDDKYWLQLQNFPTSGSPVYKEATLDASGWKGASAPSGPGVRGANCVTTPSIALPTPPAGSTDPTLGDWSATDPTGGSGYPACVLTWDLAFDDNAPVWGSSDAEQAKARTVKDYLTYAVSSIGQAGLLSYDYSPLSPALAAAAQAGVNSIGWNKSSGTVVTPPDTTPTTPTTPTTLTTPTTPTTPTVIDNNFTLASAKVKGTAITVALKLPGAGKLAVKASFKYKGKTITFASVSASVKGGSGTVKLKAGSKAKSALKKVRSAKVTFKVTYTPTGGKANSKSKTVTVKGGKKK